MFHIFYIYVEVIKGSNCILIANNDLIIPTAFLLSEEVLHLPFGTIYVLCIKRTIEEKKQPKYLKKNSFFINCQVTNSQFFSSFGNKFA